MYATKFNLLAAAVLLALAAPAVRAQQPDAKAETAQLVAVLQSDDARLFDKAKACQRLGAVGTPEAVPVLAALLSNEELSHYARYGLEPMPFEEAGAALREGLGTLQGKLLVGVINTVGIRRDAAAAGTLKKFLAEGDPEIASAAAAALGRIGGADSAQALLAALAAKPALREAVGDAGLVCAEQLLAAGDAPAAAALYDALRKAELPKQQIVAATRGAILARGAEGVPLLVEQLQSPDAALFGVALRAARELEGFDLTKSLAAELPNLSPDRQALVVLAIGDRGDPSGMQVALEAAEESPVAVRLAAVYALKQLGNETAVPVLFAMAVGEDETLAAAAQQVLVALRSPKVDDAIAAMLDQQDSKTRQVVIALVGQRRIAAASDALFQAADSDDEQVRLTALRALGETIPLEQMPTLIARLVAPKSDEAKAVVQEALRATVVRMGDRDAAADKLLAGMSGAPLEAQVFLIDLLGAVGGEKALDALAGMARSGDDALQDASTRVLGEWMSPEAAPVLLALAKSNVDNKYRIRALRGYIRIARQLQMADAERLAMSKEALAAAERDQERTLVLEVLGRVPSPEALQVVAGLLAQPGVKDLAAEEAVKMAEKVVAQSPAAVAEAMKQVTAATSNADLTRRAQALIKRAGSK